MGIRDRIDLAQKSKKSKKEWEKFVEAHLKKQGIEVWE